jgi:hypothetical protein
MSFGYSHYLEESARAGIKRQLNDAIAKREERIIFLAAASNSGANDGEQFPASHGAVIAIRSTDSKGASQNYNPPEEPGHHDVIATLGTEVTAAWLPPEHERIESGTSVATPIAAGIAALILDAARLTRAGSSSLDANDPLRKLWTREGMEHVLREHPIGRSIGGKLWYINIGDFSRMSNERRKISLSQAAAKLR